MSTFPSQQPCPRCQFPLDMGVAICPQCGLNIAEPIVPQVDSAPLSQPLPGSSVETPQTAEALPGVEAAGVPAAWTMPGQPPFGGIYPPEGLQVPPTPIKPRRGRRVALIAISIVLVIILGAGGSLAYVLTRPKPVIQATSNYHVGTVLAGAANTSIAVTGQKFSGNASITFLLDGQPAPGAHTAQSDSDGSVQADLTVTSDWSVGKHTITAKDNQGYATKVGIPVEIVAPGVAGTPGPNGSPADSATFSLLVTVQPRETDNGDQLDTFQATLNVTGQPDPAGGTVCQDGDDGQTQSDSFPLSGTNLTVTETYAFSCKGHYQSGKITYTETLLSEVLKVSDGDSCGSSNLNIPFEELDGSFSGANLASGTFTRIGLILPCQSGNSFDIPAEDGTWTAQE